MGDRDTVLVTGASAGIGLEFAKVFAAEGARLVLVARRRERLERLADELAAASSGERPHVIAFDLAEAGAGARLLEATTAAGLGVDVLVNNAGFGARGPLVDVDAATLGAMVDVNVRALTDLARAFLPPMLLRGRGGIINVASTAAFQPGPNMAVYYATKAYVLSLSEALFEEARRHGVTVSCLCPGPTATEFREVAGVPGSRLARIPEMDAPAVVRAGLRGFRRGRPVVVPGLFNRAGSVAARFAPKPLLRRAIGWLQA